MSEFKYVITRPEVETSDELEKKIVNYAREKGVRMPRARRQLIEKGLAVVETELPEMTEREKSAFREKIEGLLSLIRKRQGKEVNMNERSFT